MEELEMLNQEQEIWHTGDKEKLMEECMVEMVSLEQRVGMRLLDQLEGMSRELTRYKKKVAGLRSKIISMERKGRVSYFNNIQCAMEDTTTKIKACNKCTQTDMLDVRKALIQVEEETDRDMRDGIRYYGMCNKKKLTSGYIESYARISSSQPNSSVNPKTLRERAKLSFDIMGIISGGRFCDDGERHILAVKLIKTNVLFFQRAAEDAGILRERKISVKDAISIKALS